MRVLLMIPINRTYVIMPSLGLGYIAAVLQKAGHEVSILHCLREKFTFADFDDYVRKNKFDLWAIQMFSFDMTPAKKHLAIIKKHQPRAATLVGGYHPSGDPEGILPALPQADFAMVGEAELAFPLLCAALSGPTPDFKSVPNLVWRNRDAIEINPVRMADNLDQIPFPAWELMDPRTYPEAPHGAFFKHFPTAPIICTRGCPCMCTFCSGKAVTTNKTRRRSADNVIQEIKHLKDNYGVLDFLIEDENFTAHKNLVQEFCQKLVAAGLNIHWSCPSGVRLDTLTEENLKLMEQSGCYSLSVGIEFGSQRIHDLTKKKLTLEVIREKLDLIRRRTAIKTTGFFLFGIPGESRSEMEATVRFAKSLDIDRAQFNNFMPLPGSEIYRELKRRGQAQFDYDRFFVHDVAYVPEGMTLKEMKNLQRRAYLGFYLRPVIIWNILKEIISPRHFYRLLKRFFDAMR
ncbi:B12-binding domain-containing radical SAM protein [candidate division FCPU426 bacterium]|nr:B12-binding domain-containing radical SAM protein [candidate division FCPU426 bacterium]